MREVAGQKTAALRMSLDAVERQGMPFRGETGGIGAGQGMGHVPGAARDAAAAGAADGARAGTADGAHSAAEPGPANDAAAVRHAHLAQGSRRSIPLDPELQARLDEARRAASEHAEHGERRAPRPERLQR